MSKRLARIKYWMLVIALLVILPGDALAAKNYRDVDAKEAFVVNTYGMKVYEKPTTKADVEEVVPYARNVKCFYVRNGWAKVYTVNRVLGYCQKEYLSDKNPNTCSMTMYCQQKEAPFYTRPDVNSGVMGHLYRDEAVKVVAVTPMGDWLRFQTEENEENKWYYVQRPRMDTAKYVKGKDAWCAKQSMQIFYNPEMTTSLGTLYFGQDFVLVAQKGEIAKIRSRGGIIGYCKLSDITPVNPNNENRTVYTQVEGNYLYKSSTDLGGRIRIRKNVEMKLLGLDETRYWARVEFNGGNYYVPAIYLDATQRNGDYKKVVARNVLDLRAGTKKSSDVVTTVPTGTPLWLVGATDSYARVATAPDANGHFSTGYVELEYLM